MKLKNIKDIKNLKGKRVLLRLDLNVPLNKKGKVDKHQDWRLEKALPTIKYLVTKKAKIIIVAHLGRPEGKVVPKLSMLPVANRLSRLIKKPIEFWADDFRDYYEDSEALENSSIAMLENIRFQPREKMNCKRLAKALSKLGDIYINDAFGNIHRNHSSMEAVTNYLPSYSGLLIQEEIEQLSQVLQTKKGLVCIIGGAKIATKVKLIEKLSKQADNVLVGGALANNFIKAEGYSIGKSLVDKKYIATAKKLLKKNVTVPIDVLVASSPQAKKYKKVSVAAIPPKMMALDIGPVTVRDYLQILHKAKLVVWNGPLGYFENRNFVQSSRQIMKALAKSKAQVIIGGGETVQLVEQLRLTKKCTLVSTGGGAMLSVLQGSKLPSLERVKK